MSFYPKLLYPFLLKSKGYVQSWIQTCLSFKVPEFTFWNSEVVYSICYINTDGTYKKHKSYKQHFNKKRNSINI